MRTPRPQSSTAAHSRRHGDNGIECVGVFSFCRISAVSEERVKECFILITLPPPPTPPPPSSQPTLGVDGRGMREQQLGSAEHTAAQQERGTSRL